jgi:large subunit ribosomal protein L10
MAGFSVSGAGRRRRREDLNRDEKAAVVEEISEQISGAEAIFAVDYRGISVPQAAELRSRLREADASFRVVKNRLTKLAADQAGREELKELLDGPTALTFVRGDTASAAKAISTFNREHDVLTFKGGFMEGLTLDEAQFTSIARLPSRDVLNGQFAGVVASPLTGLVRGLNAMISGLANQLQQMAEQGLVSGQAPAAEQGEADPAAPGGEAEEADGSDSEEAAGDESEDQPAEEAPAEAPSEPAPAEEQPDTSSEGAAEEPAAEQGEADGSDSSDSDSETEEE